jgi:acetone carboxylase gamma subunit
MLPLRLQLGPFEAQDGLCPAWQEPVLQRSCSHAACAQRAVSLVAIKIDRFYPSSKTCHACKHVLDFLTLDIREWVCPECGVVHDRDTNAALNILAEGLSAAACGGSGRPVGVRAPRATPVEAGNAHS